MQITIDAAETIKELSTELEAIKTQANGIDAQIAKLQQSKNEVLMQGLKLQNQIELLAGLSSKQKAAEASAPTPKKK